MKLPEFQDLMQKQAQDDRKQRYVNVTAPTLEEALRKAGLELGVPVKKLSYEILDHGSKGMFGIGKKDLVLMAYPEKEPEDDRESLPGDLDFSFDEKVHKDGRVSVRISSTGVLVRVTPPQGDGERVGEARALSAVEARWNGEINTGMLSKVVRRADGEWAKIADMDDYQPSQDAQLSVQITDMEMKAFLVVQRPGPRGADCTAEKIRAYLQVNRVVEGYKEEVLQELEDNPSYGTSILVAEGLPAKNGADAKVLYSFETSKKIKVREMDGGRVDFKDLNTINNVVEGQVLAKLVPMERGVPGRTVTGKTLPAKDGKPKELVIGNNVRLSDDRKQALAGCNGQVILNGEKISVEPIYVVEGNVNLKNGGNIVFLGSVDVHGNVEDGFSVKAAGNLEVKGSIEKCEIDVEGDVIVHNGITGKGGANIKAGGTIWSKFIENAVVEAGGLVVVSEGIVNSTIGCDHKIICRGKRANIVGGTIRASEEIDAKTLGSVAGVETVLEVGFDPKIKVAMDQVQEKIKNLEKEHADLELNLGTLEKLFKVKKEQPQEKKDHYLNLQKRQASLATEMAEATDELQKYNQQLNDLKNNGKVSASSKVFPGVKIQIRDAVLPVKNEYKAITFVAEKGVVKVTKYVESEDDISIGKSGKD